MLPNYHNFWKLRYSNNYYTPKATDNLRKPTLIIKGNVIITNNDVANFVNNAGNFLFDISENELYGLKTEYENPVV